MSNIKQTKDGLVEKSTGRKIESPLDVDAKPDIQIRKLLFQKRKQYPYSTDRRYAAMVVDEMGKQSTEIVDRFNGFIDKEWQAVCDTFKVEHMDTPSWNTFILWATPEVICRAVIYSFAQRVSK